MNQENEKPNRKAVIVSVIFSAVVLSYIAYVGISRRIALAGEVRYTVGVTDGIQLSAAGRDIKYFYKVNGKSYKDVTTYAYNSKKRDGHYLVKFSVEHPEMSELYQNNPIPMDIVAPPEGWKSIKDIK